MRETEFLGKLNNALDSLPADQREDIMVEYRSHFFEGKNRGKSEEAIAESFGDPRAIAQTYKADYHLGQWQKPEEGQGVGKSVSHLLRGIFVLFSLLFFNFFFMLWPVLAWAGVLFSFWVTVVVMTIASVVCAIAGLMGGIAGLVLSSSSAQFAVFFYSLGTGALSILLGIGVYYLSRFTVDAILRYIKLNVNLVTA